METSVNKYGRTSIPAAIRKRHHIREENRLVWLDDGEVIRIVPIPSDPLAALRGSVRGGNLLECLARNRREDRETWGNGASAAEPGSASDVPGSSGISNRAPTFLKAASRTEGKLSRRKR
jgi:bifunctional DNA-binding transcriptional regulator/antitoxin component of YhaV-PrlF toxin-antitoxin module